MMRVSCMIVGIIGLLLWTSCQKREIDVSGVYVGSAPCHNCRGIYVKVIINKDGTARLTADPEDTIAARGRTGSWTLLKDSIIRIDGVRDTFYYKYMSPQQIAAVYFPNGIFSEMEVGYMLYKDTLDIN